MSLFNLIILVRATPVIIIIATGSPYLHGIQALHKVNDVRGVSQLIYPWVRSMNTQMLLLWIRNFLEVALWALEVGNTFINYYLLV